MMSTSSSSSRPILWQWTNKNEKDDPRLLQLQQLQKSTNRSTSSWESKHDMAIWLGTAAAFHTHDDGPPFEDNDDPTELCRQNMRCNFVLQHRNSSLIEAKLTDNFHHHQTRIPDELVEDKRRMMSLEAMTKYKILISLEGNDIANELVWQLYSDCLVMMPPPTLTTWLMEELLEPWVHYVPILFPNTDKNYNGGSLPNMTNAEEMVQWVLHHPDESKLMVERSTMFIQDLIFHNNDNDDDDEDAIIRKEIAKRYRQHWRPTMIVDDDGGGQEATTQM